MSKKTRKVDRLILDGRCSIEPNFDFCFQLRVSLLKIGLCRPCIMMEQVPWRIDLKNISEAQDIPSCPEDSMEGMFLWFVWDIPLNLTSQLNKDRNG